MNEIDSKTMAAIRSIPTTTRTFLGGFRFDCAQDDEKFDIEVKWAEEIVTNNRPKEENGPEEVDKVEKVGENETSLNEKDKVFRDALVVLLKRIEIKTLKEDKLIKMLEDLGENT